MGVLLERCIQAPDFMDPFSGSATSIRPTSPNPFHPLFAFPFPPSKSCLSFIPSPISISSLAVEVKGRLQDDEAARKKGSADPSDRD
jgi:hypothetical protein